MTRLLAPAVFATLLLYVLLSILLPAARAIVAALGGQP